MDRNRGGVQATGGVFVSDTDTFDAVAAGNYSGGDVISATVSDTATTPLRSVTLGRVGEGGGEGYVVYWEVTTDNVSFVPRIRVYLYTVAQPTTAIQGDNVASAPKFANLGEFIATFDLPALATPTGADYNIAVRDDLRIPFQCAAGSKEVYYRYVLLDSDANEAAGQEMRTRAVADVN